MKAIVDQTPERQGMGDEAYEEFIEILDMIVRSKNWDHLVSRIGGYYFEEFEIHVAAYVRVYQKLRDGGRKQVIYMDKRMAEMH